MQCSVVIWCYEVLLCTDENWGSILGSVVQCHKVWCSLDNVDAVKGRLV